MNEYREKLRSQYTQAAMTRRLLGHAQDQIRTELHHAGNGHYPLDEGFIDGIVVMADMACFELRQVLGFTLWKHTGIVAIVEMIESCTARLQALMHADSLAGDWTPEEVLAARIKGMSAENTYFFNILDAMDQQLLSFATEHQF